VYVKDSLFVLKEGEIVDEAWLSEDANSKLRKEVGQAEKTINDLKKKYAELSAVTGNEKEKEKVQQDLKILSLEQEIKEKGMRINEIVNRMQHMEIENQQKMELL
jgi:predicted RNase H-like nuclease (RuvC/YqgF family)